MERRRGSTLISVLVVLSVIAVYVGAAYSLTLNLRRHTERSVQFRHAVAVADGTLQIAFGHWRQTCRELGDAVPSTTALANLPLPTAEHFPSLVEKVESFSVSRGENPGSGDRFTIANYKLQALTPAWEPTEDPVPSYGRSPEDRSVYYLATADVTLPTINSATVPLTTKLSQVFRKRIEAPWDYAFFYTDYLDVHAGAPMSVRGPVHTMGDAFLGRSDLSFTDQVSFGGLISMRPAGPGKHPADPGGTDSAPPSFPSDQPPRADTGKVPFGIEPHQLKVGDGNPDNDSYREYIEIRQGPVEDDPFSKGGRKLRLYDRADVRIEVDAANVVTIRDSADAVCGPTSTDLKRDYFDVFTAALTTGEEIRDHRESSFVNVRLVSLDVSVLNSALRPAGGANTGPVAGRLANKPFNRLIYIRDESYDRSAGRLRAVRLRNGAVLPPGGLGVATENPLYIQGDYNTGRTPGNEPPSNRVTERDPSVSTVASYTWQPSAVFADAVSLLSNSWTDGRSFEVLSDRDASNTTYNTSIVAGVRLVRDGETGYSGGIENFPRFLENWGSSVAVTVYGSMVQLFESKQADRMWSAGGQRYTPPIREFHFDERYASAPPPGTFQLVTYDRLAWKLNRP